MVESPLDEPLVADFHYISQAYPIQLKGFGSNLALFGDLMLGGNWADPEETAALSQYLIELFGCISGEDNPKNLSILGMYSLQQKDVLRL